jgi:hypothetical protein
MAMRSRKLLLCLAGAGLVPLGGCAPVDAGFGEALRYDMAVQTVDPDPQYPEGSLQPGYHGEKAQKATERYRKGAIKAPAAQTSSSGGSGN